MGKREPQLPLRQQNRHGPSLSTRCSMGFSRLSPLFSFKCVFIVLLSGSVFVPAIFSTFRHELSRFDAKRSIKNSATVRAYFTLEKPVWFLLPQILRLEYDINDEIGVPYTQIAVLSMHEVGASNSTYVVFGVLSDPMNRPINAVSLSVLRSSLIELFTQHSNLTLTTSIFGHPSSFGILKFPSGITIIPKSYASLLTLPQEVLFNFTLRSSLQEIEENSVQLKEQLNSGLHLMPSESLFVQVTNKGGSTKDPPVTIQASIESNVGNIPLQRLKQLAETINGSSHAGNLGLNHYVFGKVKEISLSSSLSHTLDAPTPSPAPSPDLNRHVAASPAVSPSPDLPPCYNCGGSSPSPSCSPAPSLDPSCSHGASPGPSPVSDPGPSPPPMDPWSEKPPAPSPFPAVSYGSGPSQDNGYRKGSVAPPLPVLPSSSSSSATGSFNHLTSLSLLFFFLALHIQ